MGYHLVFTKELWGIISALVLLGKALLFIEVYIYRDLSLMVKYETFNLCYIGSNPIDLNKLRGY